MEKYVKLKDVLRVVQNATIIAGNDNESLISQPDLSDELFSLEPADVISRSAIQSKVEQAIEILNTANSTGTISYYVYSLLFDKISIIADLSEEEQK